MDRFSEMKNFIKKFSNCNLEPAPSVENHLDLSTLTQLASCLEPGWYFDLDNLSCRVYVTADDSELKFIIHIFSIENVGESRYVIKRIMPTPFAEMLKMVTDMRKRLIPIHEINILQYETVTKDVVFWIFTHEKKVRWSGDPYEHRLENDRCVLTRDIDAFSLELLEDDKIKINRQVNPGMSHGIHLDDANRFCKAMCPRDIDIILTPILFSETDYPINRYSNICPISANCLDCFNFITKQNHASTTIIFKNAYRDDALIEYCIFDGIHKSTLEEDRWKLKESYEKSLKIFKD